MASTDQAPLQIEHHSLACWTREKQTVYLTRTAQCTDPILNQYFCKKQPEIKIRQLDRLVRYIFSFYQQETQIFPRLYQRRNKPPSSLGPDQIGRQTTGTRELGKTRWEFARQLKIVNLFCKGGSHSPATGGPSRLWLSERCFFQGAQRRKKNRRWWIVWSTFAPVGHPWGRGKGRGTIGLFIRHMVQSVNWLIKSLGL